MLHYTNSQILRGAAAPSILPRQIPLGVVVHSSTARWRYLFHKKTWKISWMFKGFAVLILYKKSHNNSSELVRNSVETSGWAVVSRYQINCPFRKNQFLKNHVDNIIRINRMKSKWSCRRLGRPKSCCNPILSQPSLILAKGNNTN